MSGKEYIQKKDAKQEEQTWCRISDAGDLEYMDWTFVEQQAQQFDIAGKNGARDQVMTTCKLLLVTRKETLRRVSTLIGNFADGSNDAASVLLYDPTKALLPSPATFVFFHVGDDITQPSRLVDSLKKTNPGSEIYMITDVDTPVIEGVTRFEQQIDRERLMAERLRCYAALKLDKPAIYLDTDMVVRGFVNLPAILGDKTYVFCNRSFDRMVPFNGQQRGLDFSEYHDRPIGLVYPIIGCFIVARTSADLLPIFDLYLRLPDKYHKWYGDQEALREFVNTLKVSEFNLVEEAIVACLPEYIGNSSPLIVHYKGARKNATA
jgi:hypothetical protein